MKANHIEREFLKTIREASSDDCRVLFRILHEVERDSEYKNIFIDSNDEYTDIGLLMGTIKEELMINGVLKRQFSE